MPIASLDPGMLAVPWADWISAVPRVPSDGLGLKFCTDILFPGIAPGIEPGIALGLPPPDRRIPRPAVPARTPGSRTWSASPGVIAADTKITLPAGSTGNALVDALVSGTHNLHIGGKLAAAKGIGKFDLQSVSVDGIPVPNILIDTLIQKYAKPKYPDVDLKEPFEMPWGIQAIDIGQHKATITY